VKIFILMLLITLVVGGLLVVAGIAFFDDYKEKYYMSKKQYAIHKFRKYLLLLGKIQPSYCKDCIHCNNSSMYKDDYRCKIPFKTVNDTPYHSQEEDEFPYIRHKNEYNTCTDFEKEDAIERKRYA